jgi:hypothetical protein
MIKVRRLTDHISEVEEKLQKMVDEYPKDGLPEMKIILE